MLSQRFGVLSQGPLTILRYFIGYLTGSYCARVVSNEAPHISGSEVSFCAMPLSSTSASDYYQIYPLKMNDDDIWFGLVWFILPSGSTSGIVWNARIWWMETRV